MTRIILCGSLGRMGGSVAAEIAAEDDLELGGAIEAPGLEGSVTGVQVTSNLEELLPDCDVVVDFTNPEAALSHIETSAAAGKPIVVGTTGFTPAQLEQAQKAEKHIPLLISPNMSAGVNLMFRIVGDVAAALEDFDAEIIEIHHNRKKDSPSGTAARIAEAIELARPGTDRIYGRAGMLGARPGNELGIHSLRGGDVTGEHTAVFAGEGERFEITHRAHSRRTFARGTIRAIRFIMGKPPGRYTMNNVLGLE